MGEPDVSDLISVGRAIEIIDATPVRPRAVMVPLHEARGLRLAEDLHADRDYPPFDKSLMDGFAVRAEDVRRVPATLDVIGEIAAGATATTTVGPGQTMAIMTGAPLPPGADGVVPVEDVRRRGGVVEILRADHPGRYIARRGQDCPAGRVVLRTGDVLGAAQLAVAASVGAANVNVFAAPRVAVLGTGDELVPVRATPGPAQIRNSNNVMLVALLERLGCRATDLGVVPDDPATIRAKLTEGMAGSDVLCVTGGMSMGEYDYVPRLLIELAVDLKITKLRIKPGKPFVFGMKGDKFAFGLPGNPVSAFVCTLRLASRLLSRLAGGEGRDSVRTSTGKLALPLPPNGPREFYQPAAFDAARSAVRPLDWKGSADVYTLAAANALIVRPENAPALAAGDPVDLLEV